jgi:hypothetical protein
MHHDNILGELMSKTADEVCALLRGWACRNPEDLFTAGATSVAQIPGTTLFVPVVEGERTPISGRRIGFSAEDCSRLRLFEVERDEVAEALERHGVGLRASVTWAGDGFYGHLEVWEPTGGVQDALTRLRERFDAWPEVEGDGVVLEAPPAGSDKDIALLLWGSDLTGTGQLGVSVAGTATVIAAVTGLDASRAVLLETFERLAPVASSEASLSRTLDLATARVVVNVVDAAERLVERSRGPLAG